MRRGIDHLVLCARDLDRAVALYRRLGFTTTPRAEHPWGTDNSLVQLKGCFLELLTVARAQRIEPATDTRFSFGAFAQRFLDRGEGMAMLVFESVDAEADRAELVARGLHPWERFDFEREAKLPDGESVRVAFSLAFATDARIPDLAFFYCQQHAPQYFWKPEYQVHANGAVVVKEVVMLAEDPPSIAGFFATIQEPDAVTATGEELTVDTPRGRIVVLSPRVARERYGGIDLARFSSGPSFLGFSVTVEDPDRAAALLAKADVAFDRVGATIRVRAEDAYGVMIELAPAS